MWLVMRVRVNSRNKQKQRDINALHQFYLNETNEKERKRGGEYEKWTNMRQNSQTLL